MSDQPTLPAELTDPITARPAPVGADLRDRIAEVLYEDPGMTGETGIDVARRMEAAHRAHAAMTVVGPVLADRWEQGRLHGLRQARAPQRGRVRELEEEIESMLTVEEANSRAWELKCARVRELEAEVARLRGRVGVLEEAVRAARAAVRSAGDALAFSPRDWGVDHRDAWLYAILLGWSCEDDHKHDVVCEGDAALTEIADRHRWDADTVARVTRHRAAITQLDQASARDTAKETDRG